MRNRAFRGSSLVLLAVVAAGVPAPAQAQTGCRTGNCGDVNPPAACGDRAAPHVLRVDMTGNIPFVFSPDAPKIEPGECIDWVRVTSFHSSSGASCPDTNTVCSLPPPATCEWETGNVVLGDPPVTCHYDTTAFPAGTSAGFYCRIHATPTTGTMRGTLRVTTPIVVAVDKVGGDVRLDWTGGGLPGDETFMVARADDAPFSALSEFDPTGGATGRSFLDPGEVDPLRPSRFYLVRNRQAGE